MQFIYFCVFFLFVCCLFIWSCSHLHNTSKISSLLIREGNILSNMWLHRAYLQQISNALMLCDDTSNNGNILNLHSIDKGYIIIESFQVWLVSHYELVVEAKKKRVVHKAIILAMRRQWHIWHFFDKKLVDQGLNFDRVKIHWNWSSKSSTLPSSLII